MRGGAGGLELLDGDLVLLVGAGEHLDGHAVGQRDRLGVRRPVRRGQQHLVAGVHDRLEGLIDGLLAAVRDHDLGCVDLEPRIAQRLRGDRLAQHRKPDGGGVAVVRRVVQRLGCGIHDELRCREVGLARRVADDRPAGGLEGLRLGVDLEGRRFGDRGELAGERSAFCHGYERSRTVRTREGVPWRFCDRYRVAMGEWMWSAVVMSIAVVVAGGIAWWLARGCVVTIIGAAGAILGGLASLGCLVLLIDLDTALRAAALLTAASGIWLLAWALAGGLRNKRLVARAAADAAATALR